MSIQSTNRISWSVPTRLRRAQYASLFADHRRYALETDLSPMGGFSLPVTTGEFGYADHQLTALHPGARRQGAGRAVFYKGKYLKGVGRTALAGNWGQARDTVHGTGHLTATSAAREMTISHYLGCKGLEDTIVACEGVLVRELDPEFGAAYRSYADATDLKTAPADRHLQAITVKNGNFARWSNLSWLAMQSGSEAGDITRWCQLAGHFASSPADPAARNIDPLAATGWTPSTVATALCSAVERSVDTLLQHFEAGVYWNSYHNNRSLDGRFLDLELPMLLGEAMVSRIVHTEGSLENDNDRDAGLLFGNELLFEAKIMRTAIGTMRQRFRLLATEAELPVERTFLDQLADALHDTFDQSHWLFDLQAQGDTLARAYAPHLKDPGDAPRIASLCVAEDGLVGPEHEAPRGRMLHEHFAAPEPGMNAGVYVLDVAKWPASEQAAREREVMRAALEAIDGTSNPDDYLDAMRESLEAITRVCAGANVADGRMGLSTPSSSCVTPASPEDTRAFASGAMIVAAHPDDEALWFSSILGSAPHVAIAYLDERDQPDLVAERQAVRSAYPLRSVSWLQVQGSGNFGREVFNGDLSEYGAPLEAAETDQRAYAESYRVLVERLRPLIESAQPERLVTHAPWGEYGHADHVQAFRAVEQIAGELDIPVWFPLYVSARTYQVSRRWVHKGAGEGPVTLPCDTKLAHQLRDLYIEKGCWTWDANFQWFEHDTFVRADRSGTGGARVPMNFVDD